MDSGGADGNAALKTSLNLYRRAWEPGKSNDSLSLIYDKVREGAKVLDLGCAIGELGAALKRNKSCQVFGVETNPEAIAIAKLVLDDVSQVDLNSIDFKKQFGESRFNHVIFADVLEHLQDPESVLRESKEVLARDGTILISVPNIAHAAVRLGLLQGRFDYTEEGLLDKTHIRFFTRDTLIDMLSKVGLIVSDIERVYIGAGDSELKIAPNDLISEELIRKVESLPDATTYQFIVSAIPEARPGDAEKANKFAARVDGQIAEKQSRLIELGTEASKSELLDKRTNDLEQGLVHLANVLQEHRISTELKLTELGQRVERFANFGPINLLRRVRRKLKGM